MSVDAALAEARRLLGLSDFPAACALLEQAAATAPGHPGIAAALAAAYRRDARYGDAVRVAEAVGAAAGVQLLYEQGMSLAHLGRGEAALAAFDAALAQDPERAAAWMASAGPALEVEGADAAIIRLRRACSCIGANGKYWGLLGAALRLLGRPEAEALFAAELARHPRRRSLWDGVEALRPLLAPGVRVFGLSASLLRAALAEARQPGLVLEFGVRRGTSITVLAEAAGQGVHGFDSFEGLPADWGGEGAGVLTTKAELPMVPANVTLHPGWFDATLAPFLARHAGPVRLVNVDSDIYQSARLVLSALADRIRPGTVIVFDEMIGNRTWAEDEYKAWCEFSAEHDVRAEVFALSPFTKQVALRVR